MKQLLIIFLFMMYSIASHAGMLSSDQIKERIIQESINSYPGSCPCPYNRTRNGSRCGKRSAYSKPGGYEPICYKSDITDKMVKDYNTSR